MADKAGDQTPAAGTAPAGASASGTTAPSGTTGGEVDYKAALETERQARVAAEQARQTAERNYSHLRSAHGRLTTEVGQYRSLYGGLDAGEGAGSMDQGVGTTPANDGGAQDFTVDPMAADVAVIKFRTSVKDLDAKDGDKGPTIAEEVDAILKGENRGDFAAFRRNPTTGKVELDLERTLHSAYKHVKLTRYERAEAKAQEAAAASNAAQNRLRASGFVSGESAAEVAESLDIDNLTSDQMIEKGLVQFDPTDPPRAARKMARK